MPTRWGAAELYGLDLPSLPSERLRELAAPQAGPVPCPFRPASQAAEAPSRCNKKGGVCSLRLYEKDDGAGVRCAGDPVTTCPNRFLEAGIVVPWVGEILLGTSCPTVISELPFLMGESESDGEEMDAVGKIDQVLVRTDGPSLAWCALEMQAVYFSGKSMENDFRLMRDWQGPGIPFPQAQRRPDFRSSGPKRLMPQLQIKVPTISRWGRKMAVVVDLGFWQSLGEMREVEDVSNCDIAWFVVSYAPPIDGVLQLRRHQVHFTTLTHAVEGLTSGRPMSLPRFEAGIRSRLKTSAATTDSAR